jgi:hypothetical protein
MTSSRQPSPIPDQQRRQKEYRRHGWDSDAVSAALLGSTEPTLW